MADERSVQVLSSAHESSEKFDYFLCAITGALFAYMTQNFAPKTIGFDVSLFEPLALLFLIISFVAGMLRIEKFVIMKMDNARMLDALEKAKACTQLLMNSGEGYVVAGGRIIHRAEAQQARMMFQHGSEQLEASIKRQVKKGQLYYQIRNAFLIGGFIALLLGRVLTATPLSASFGIASSATNAPAVK